MRKAASGLGAALVAVTVGVGLAGAASALPFTLSSSIGWAGGGAAGTLDPISPAEYAALVDVQCLAGTCPVGAGDDIVFFTLTVTSGAVDQLRVSNLFETIESVGFYDDGTGGDPNSVTRPVASQALFGDAGLGWNFTGTTEVLFLAHTAGELPTVSGISFAITPDGSATLPNVTGSLVPIPEPTTALLVAVGAAALAARRSRLRRG